MTETSQPPGTEPRTDPELTPAQEKLVQRLGIHYEREGFPRIAGQVFGLLLLSREPLTLDGLASRLNVSKGSVSTNVRLLERMGSARRVSRAGDRRDWWQIREDLTQARFRVAVQGIQDMQEILEETLPVLRSEGEGGVERLEALHEFHSFVLNELAAMMRRWEDRRSGEEDSLSSGSGRMA
jgi:DNA-binding transcriptional regulator GbsR (MarR family)